MIHARHNPLLLAGTVVAAVLSSFVSDPMSAHGSLWSHGTGGAEAQLLLLWAIGHCDTLDGSLVKLARKALEIGNVNLVLPWVPAQDEAEPAHAAHHAH
ncbi:MAG TPA: DUF6448 family protein [Burkholderiales bacterium]|nr:DUF6448 family protein [Burkholderiales bacterium]